LKTCREGVKTPFLHAFWPVYIFNLGKTKLLVTLTLVRCVRHH